MNLSGLEGHIDSVLPFAVDALDVRGRAVRLGPALDTIIRRHGYPDAVARALGEACALAALLGSALKTEGRFQVQTQTQGAISLMVADCDCGLEGEPMRLRAMARFDEGAVQTSGASTGTLLGEGLLALTVEQAGNRYQGIVTLNGEGLEEAAHRYFAQSEQIPTRVRLAVGEIASPGQPACYRAGGVMVQFLPEGGAAPRDLDPGDAPEGVKTTQDEDDRWQEAMSLTATIEDHELVDPAISTERLLYRLFHESGARVFTPRTITEKCHCSRDKVLAMLRGFSREDKAYMIADDGLATVTCEFCSTPYRFTLQEFDAPPP